MLSVNLAKVCFGQSKSAEPGKNATSLGYEAAEMASLSAGDRLFRNRHGTWRFGAGLTTILGFSCAPKAVLKLGFAEPLRETWPSTASSNVQFCARKSPAFRCVRKKRFQKLSQVPSKALLLLLAFEVHFHSEFDA